LKEENMQKRKLVSIILFVMVLFPVFIYPEDAELNVASVMRKILGEVRDINKAFEAGDYYTTAVHLMELAKHFKSLEAVTPSKGEKAEWNRIHNDIIKEAFIAIGACAREDGEATSASLKKISTLQNEGHKLFR
jgi:hypothetical protein